MFDSLPEVFGRRFLVAHLLPAIVTGTTLTLVLSGPDRLKAILMSAIKEPSIGISILVMLWIFALLLMASNRLLVRLVEGYGRLNPARLLSPFRKWEFRRLQKARVELDTEHKNALEKGGQLTEDKKRERLAVHLKLACRFPDEARWVLPTSFGNAIRSFEVYPRVMYGLDAVACWFRLSAVIPRDFMTRIEDAKAQVDLWLNIWVGSLVVMVLAAAHALLRVLPKCFQLTDCKVLAVSPTWTFVGSFLVALVSISLATGAAVQWGNWVKASFDMFRGPLARNLGLHTNLKLEPSRQFWDLVSRAYTYSSRDRLVELEKTIADWSAQPSAPSEDSKTEQD